MDQAQLDALLAAYDENVQDRLNQQRLMQARALREQQSPKYTTGRGALFGGLASIGNAIQSGMIQNRARQGMQDSEARRKAAALRYYQPMLDGQGPQGAQGDAPVDPSELIPPQMM